MTNDVERNHHDLLNELNKKITVSEKIAFLHRVSLQSCDFIHRIGVAVYDSKSDMLKTFAHSSDDASPLQYYQAKLSQAKSLYQIFVNGKPRVVNDLSVFNNSKHEHAKRIKTHGYRSSYTVPMYQNEELTGFVFFNSRDAGVFQEEKLPNLDMIARLISLLVSMEHNQVRTLQGALRSATCFSGHKDPETGAHLERMARFSRLIAREIAQEYGLSDEFVEAIFWFAPMHDIGKIAIPDRIIRKPGKLTKKEFEVMKTHSTKGRDILNTMLGNFNLDGSGFASMIANIAEFHHENIDGSGYPKGLKGEEIPIEARIIAVADVFDALTSKRSYKNAWSNEDAFATLRTMSAWKLDSKCVDILMKHGEEITEIQTQFMDDADNETSGDDLFEIASTTSDQNNMSPWCRRSNDSFGDFELFDSDCPL